MKRILSRIRWQKKTIILNVLLYTVLLSGLLITMLVYMNTSKEQNHIQKYFGNVLTIIPGVQTSSGVLGDVECDWMQDQPEVEEVNPISLSSKYAVRVKSVGQGENYKHAKEKTEKEMKDISVEYKGEYHENCHMIGVQDSAHSPYFLNRGYKMIKGESLTKTDQGEKVVLVSDKLAEINNLKPGSKIVINTSAKDIALYGTGVNRKETFYIKGIYEYWGTGSDRKNCALNYENGIFAPVETLKEIYPADTVRYSMIFLKDWKQIDAFIEKMQKIFGDNTYTFFDNHKWNDILQKPLKQMKNLSVILCLCLFVGAVVIMCTLCAWKVRKSKKEIGILLTLGETKKNIILEYLLQEAGILFVSGVMAVGIVMGIISPIIENTGENYIQSAKLNAEQEDTIREEQYGKYEDITVFTEYMNPDVGTMVVPEKLEYKLSVVEVAVTLLGILFLLFLILMIQITCS